MESENKESCIVSSDALCEAWHNEERDEDDPPWSELSGPEQIYIAKRVQKVLRGDIPRRQLSVGDQLIFRGRYRMFEAQPPERFIAGRPLRRLYRDAVWDAVNLRATEQYGCVKLFRTDNLGQLLKTNMQVAGGFPYNDSFWVQGWHASVGEVPNIGSLGEEAYFGKLLRDLFTRSTATLVVGDRPQATRHLSSLLHQPWLLELGIPSRQNFDVRVEMNPPALQNVKYRLDALHEQYNGGDLLFWIHLEGWRCGE